VWQYIEEMGQLILLTNRFSKIKKLSSHRKKKRRKEKVLYK
jgi:hypothetical protein